jgi:hypothetical protein
MHSELRFQDAVLVLEKGNDLAALKQALQKLYEEELPREELQKDTPLAAYLFRMACRLVSGYLHYVETETFENHLVISHTKDIFLMKSELLGETTRLLFPPKGWESGGKAIAVLAQRAGKAGSRLMSLLNKVVVDSSVYEINALERVVTTMYRMSGKPLSESESPTASKVLIPLNEILDQLLNSPPDRLVEWVTSVIEELRAQYLQVADSVVKREMSLLRLHQRASKAGMSDSHKITKQLAMDSERFVNDVVQVMEKRLKVRSFDRAPFEEVVKVFVDFGGEESKPATPLGSNQ